jgi:hypothetical protein
VKKDWRNATCVGTQGFVWFFFRYFLFKFIQGFVSLHVEGGRPPYKFLWAGPGKVTDPAIYAPRGVYEVTVTDSAGCSLVDTTRIDELEPTTVSIQVSKVKPGAPYSGSVQVIIEGNSDPYLVIWNNGITGTQLLSNASYGSYEVTVTDRASCTYTASVFVEEEHESCPAIANCLRFKLLGSIYLRCLERISEHMVWNAQEWDVCAARALVLLAKWFTVPATIHDAESSDGGAMYAAAVLGDAIFACHARRRADPTAPNCDMEWHTLVPFFQQNETVRDLFYTMDLANGRYNTQSYSLFKGEMMEMLFHVKRGEVDVLTIGPYGFDNEPVFAPSLCRPSRLNRVTMMAIKNLRIYSDCLDMAIWPWTLTYDVVMAAAFLRDAMFFGAVKWIVPSDSAAILTIAKLGTRLVANEVAASCVWELGGGGAGGGVVRA